MDLLGGMGDLDMVDLDGGMDGGMDIVDLKKWMLDLWEKGRRKGKEKAKAAIIAESQDILRENARSPKDMEKAEKDRTKGKERGSMEMDML